MTGIGHNLSAIALSPIVFFKVFEFSGGNNLISVFCVFLFISGARAPDWLEIRTKVGTLIKHRTFTHILLLWVSVFVGALYFNEYGPFFNTGLSTSQNELLIPLVLAFSAGGILHLLGDWPNPMGIPFFTPNKRYSLNLWKSGEMEKTIVFVLIFISGGYVLGHYDIDIYELLKTQLHKYQII